MGATTARSLVFITIRAMTVVITPHLKYQQIQVLSVMCHLRYLRHLPLVRDVQGVTTMGKGAAPLITPVVRERVTVMGLVMVGGMMVIGGAKVTWYVVEITVRNMVLITMRRMTVVRGPATKAGVHGVPGHLVTNTVGTGAG